MTPGIYPGMPRDQYDAIQAINISTLIHGVKSMAHLKQYIDEGEKKSDALRFGQLVHLVVFEPHLVESRVIPAPDCEKRSNADKARWAAFNTACEINGSIGATAEELDAARAMRDAILRDPEARQLVENPGQNELAVVWKDAETGLMCKGMLDRFCMAWGWSVVADLKTTDDPRAKKFMRAVADYHYHVKAAWYLNGLNTIQPLDRRFIWLAVEKTAPHMVRMHEPTPATLAEGDAVWRRLLNEYATAIKTNHWPMCAAGIEPLDLPAWAKESA